MKSPEKDLKRADAPTTGPVYWRSLDDFAESSGFQEWVKREFPQGASELDGVNRRHFLKIMAASFALAGSGMAGCRRPEHHILPYSRQPENTIPGVPEFFASSLPGARENIPLVVETHQHRPTKIEGNGSFQSYGGSTDIFAQASVLDLYDPDRAQGHTRDGRSLSAAEVQQLLASVEDKYKATRGQGLAFLAGRSSSPTRARLVAEMQRKFPRLVWCEYDPTDSGHDEEAAVRLFGRNLRSLYRLRNAARILSLDADFLHRGPGHLRYARDFAATRRVHSPNEIGKMSRLYMAESAFSVTGGMADHRLRLASSQIPALAALVAAEIFTQTGQERAFAEQLRREAGRIAVPAKWIETCVADLLEYRGQSLVMAGPDQPVVVHQLVFLINDLLGALGRTVSLLETGQAKAESIDKLAGYIEQGRVETLVILGGNPVYDAPADLNWPILQGRVKEVIRFGYSFDETSESAQTHIAALHYLESWGDGRTYDGTVVPVQPMILPLYEGMQELELIARLAGAVESDAYKNVLVTLARLGSGRGSGVPVDRFLSDGYLPDSGSKFPEVRETVAVGEIRKVVAESDLSAPAPSKNALEVRILPDNKVWDGRYNNNPWLQECPDPMTKIAWDNVISISPRLAKKIGIVVRTPRSPVAKVVDAAKVSARKPNQFEMGREVSPMYDLTVKGATIRGPVHVQPGLDDYTVVVTLGYGRTTVGRVGRGTGYSAYPLVASNSTGHTGGAMLRETAEPPRLIANTQEHWSMEGRAIIREANVSDFEAHPKFAETLGLEAHTPAVYGSKKDAGLRDLVLSQPRGNSMYETPTFGADQQWGMTIDLNTCTGCNACVIACQSENNIPVVGKDQVTRGREMHWLRLDRYYSSGDLDKNKDEIPEDPQVSLQPMLCQQCEMAPCEQVCPVNATVHDEQGLNVMAYNRCVGTRYCANNCPYKVRRFNFFDWNKRQRGEYYKGPLGKQNTGDLQKMQKNPDVTVRMRGVMEKCTFCQQRIEAAKIDAKVNARDSADVGVADGVIKTACQQVCPTESIVFGDVADPTTRVSKLKSSDLDYAVLGYLNTRPRTTYLARLRNPNERMPGFHAMPLSRMEYELKSGHAPGHGGSSEHSLVGEDHGQSRH